MGKGYEGGGNYSIERLRNSCFFLSCSGPGDE